MVLDGVADVVEPEDSQHWAYTSRFVELAEDLLAGNFLAKYHGRKNGLTGSRTSSSSTAACGRSSTRRSLRHGTRGGPSGC